MPLREIFPLYSEINTILTIEAIGDFSTYSLTARGGSNAPR
jgi:hypothetical protein